MINKNNILTDLFLNKEVDILIKKIKPVDLQDDLKQYAFAVLCEKPAEFIIELHNRQQLKFYLVKIISNSVFSNRSGFITQHKCNDHLELDHVVDVSNENDDYHYLIEKCIKETNRLYWYHQELLKLYAEHGTYRAVSEITNIPVKSIHNAIKKAKVKLKKEIWK